MDDWTQIPLTIKSRPESLRGNPDATAPQRNSSHHPAQPPDQPKPGFHFSHLGRDARVKP